MATILTTLIATGCGTAPLAKHAAGSAPPRPVADTAACPHGAGTPIRGLAPLELSCLTGPGAVRVSRVHAEVEVLNVWASWCGPCRQEMGRLEAAHRRAGPRVLFLGVDVKDSSPQARAFLAQARVSYPHVSDPAGRLARALHLYGVPSTVVVDETGRVRWRHDGQLGRADITRLLAHLDF